MRNFPPAYRRGLTEGQTLVAGQHATLPTTSTQPTLAAAHYTVAAAYQTWLARYQAADMGGVAALYATAGELLPAYSPTISGRAAIQAFWQGCFDMGIGAMLRETHQVSCLADRITEVGAYRFLDRHQRVRDTGTYQIIWNEDQGQWQIQCDRWVSNFAIG